MLAPIPARTYVGAGTRRTEPLAMPLLFFLLLVILIAQIGFWKTLGAVVGAAAMIALLVILFIAVLVVGGLLAASRLRRF